MPVLEDYARLAPFTLEELVAAANAILRERPALYVQPRTIRYYISVGLLPPPKGGPKFARYDLEHLRRVIAIRQWLDEGVSLEQAAEKLRQGEHGGEALVVRSPRPPARAPAAPTQAPLGRARTASEGTIVRRLQLTPESVLETRALGDLAEELERVSDALRRKIRELGDSS